MNSEFTFIHLVLLMRAQAFMFGNPFYFVFLYLLANPLSQEKKKKKRAANPKVSLWDLDILWGGL